MPPENTESNDQPVFSGVEEALAHLETNAQARAEDSVAANQGAEDEDQEDTQDDLEEVTEDTLEDDEEAEDSEEDPEEETDADAESDEEDDEDEEDDGTVFLDGEGDDAVKVNAEEAKAGYMRNKAFTTKSQELAKDRKAFDTERAELLESKDAYVKALAGVKASMSEHLKGFIGIDWQQLQRDDPIEFEEKEQELTAARLAYEQVVQQEEEEGKKLLEETMGYAQEIRKQEMEKLVEHIPEFGTEDSTLFVDIREFGMQQYGFSEEELNGIYDSRMIRALTDAFRGKAQAKKAKKGKAKINSVGIKPKASKGKSTQKARAAKARKAELSNPQGLTMEQAMQALHKR